jgi:glucoamylase
VSIKKNINVALLSLSVVCFSLKVAASVPFSSADVASMKQYVFNNIATEAHVVSKYEDGRLIHSVPGAVLASPSSRSSVFSQDYQYHWVRDAAITMNEVVYLYSIATPSEKKVWRPYLLNYVNFEAKAQKEVSREGEQTLGQPKYNMDATIWEGPWGRPQNDGPALRAITMIAIANQFRQEGNDKFVRDTLLDMIRTDIDYVVVEWRHSTFGLWEEVNDQDHFFTKMVQRKALSAAAELLKKYADTERANSYLHEASQITDSLARHWNASVGYLSETVNQQDNKGGGLDTSIIIGVLLGSLDNAKDPYAVNNDRVMSTVFHLRNAFATLYRVNVLYPSRVPLLGRYPSDVYDGNQFVYGNPWILTTNALAQYYYALANVYVRLGKVAITKDNQLFFKQINPNWAEKEEVILSASNPDKFNAIVDGLVQEGDRTLATVRQYATCYADSSCMHFAEQVDRNSGQQTSAADLTWSYVSLLAALQARSS